MTTILTYSKKQDRYDALSPGVTAPVFVPAIAAGNVLMLATTPPTLQPVRSV
jgi:hypothetical protein